MLRHEQQSIHMALATVMHHSFKVHIENGTPRSQTTATRAREGEVHEQHDGLRAQKRPLTGTRPAPLAEVAGPQVRAATVGYVAAAGLSLWCRRWLVATALTAPPSGSSSSRPWRCRRRRRRKELDDEDRSARESLERAQRFLDRAASKRNRKKRKKKKLPRVARPRQGCRRLCDHQRHVPAVRITVVTQRQVPTVHSFILPVQLLDKVLDMPVVVLRQVPGLMVQKTVEPPQLQFFVGRRHPFRSAEADPHGPDAPVVQAVRFHRLFMSVHSALLGSTVDTNFASVYGEFHVFLREKVNYGS